MLRTSRTMQTKQPIRASGRGKLASPPWYPTRSGYCKAQTLSLPHVTHTHHITKLLLLLTHESFSSANYYFINHTISNISIIPNAKYVIMTLPNYHIFLYVSLNPTSMKNRLARLWIISMWKENILLQISLIQR